MFKKIDISVEPFMPDMRGVVQKRFGTFAYYRLNYLTPRLERLMKELESRTVFLGEVVSPSISPHVDHGISTVLNIYFKSGEGLTTFWHLKDGKEGFAFPGETLKNTFRRDDLEPIMAFKAQDGDAYLLDVSVIHTVENISPPRQFYQLFWTEPFEVIKDRIEALDLSDFQQ